VVVSTISGLFLIETDNKIVELNSNFVASEISCSSDYLIVNSEDTMIAFSYTGTELWKKEGVATSNVSFSNDGVKHVFLRIPKPLFVRIVTVMRSGPIVPRMNYKTLMYWNLAIWLEFILTPYST